MKSLGKSKCNTFWNKAVIECGKSAVNPSQMLDYDTVTLVHTFSQQFKPDLGLDKFSVGL